MSEQHQTVDFAGESDEETGSIRCSMKPDYRADGFCVWCRRSFSERFLTTAADGRAACTRCARDQHVALLQPQREQSDPAIAGGVRDAVVRILLRPHRVFETPWEGSLWPSIRFGLLVSIVGLVFWNSWFWIFSSHLAAEAIEVIAKQTGQRVTLQQMQVYSWISIPFVAVLRFVFGTLALHAGLRLAGAPKRMFHEHVRVYALASTALLLCVVPSWVGAFIANVAWLTTCMAFTRVRYRFSTARTLMALLPAMLIVFFFPPR